MLGFNFSLSLISVGLFIVSYAQMLQLIRQRDNIRHIIGLVQTICNDMEVKKSSEVKENLRIDSVQ